MAGEGKENCYSGTNNFLLHDQYLHHDAGLSTAGHCKGRQAQSIAAFALGCLYSATVLRRSGGKKGEGREKIKEREGD